MKTEEWKKQMSECYRSVSDFPEDFKFSEAEEEYLKKRSDKFRISVPKEYFSLAGFEEEDPIRRQFMPQAGEQVTTSWETDDPLGENSFKVTERLIHRYRDRALFLVSDTCAMYCRHCFRRDYLSTAQIPLTKKEIHRAAAYLKSHPEVKELILSGGDPLMLDDSKLEEIFSVFRESRPDIVFRLASRMLVVLPSRITDSLTDLLSKYKPLFFITQYNHPRELTEKSRKAASALVNNGIPVLNQAVLLKSVNDNVEVLSELFQELLRCSIKPYYLFQGDLAAGTSHLRVPITKGLELMKELRSVISGLALPVYAVDLPGGGGKIPLTESYIHKITETAVIFKDRNGKEYSYPVE